MAQYKSRSHSSDTDFNITGILIVCLLALLVAWSVGIAGPQGFRELIHSI